MKHKLDSIKSYILNVLKKEVACIRRKHVAVLVVLLIPMLLIGLSNYLFSFPSFRLVVEFNQDDAVSLYPDSVIWARDVERLETGEYLVYGVDSRFLVDPPNQIISSTRVVFRNPVKSDQSVQVYYAIENENLSERNSVTVFMPSGAYEVILDLPSDIYTSLRYDVDIFNEPFEIVGIYVSESPAHSRKWVGNTDGILMTLIVCLVILLVWFFTVITGVIDKWLDNLKEETNKLISSEKYRKRIADNIRNIFFIFSICFFVSYFWFRGFNMQTALFVSAIGFSVYSIIKLRNSPEKLFLSLSLIIGFLYVILHPPYVYAWDSHLHYSAAFQQSFVRVISVHAGFAFNSFSQTHTTESMVELRSFIKGIDEIPMYVPWPPSNPYNRVAYIPYAFMIFVGRSLALTQYTTALFGSMGSLVIYTFVVYFSLKRIDSGKHLMAVIALFPTLIALSTAYSTDPWVFAFILLGIAYCVYEIQNPDKKIELKSIVIMIVAFVTGLGPKAIYFPLMLVMYLIKKDKFDSNSAYKKYIISVSFALIFVLATFTIPFIASGGGGEGDHRGGAYVNAAAQTAFILQNPSQYTTILLRFMSGYVNVLSRNFATSLARLGDASYFLTLWVLVVFVALTDRNEKDMFTIHIKYKIFVFFLVFATIALICTALYISFTAVGAETIRGVQGRYLVPVVFPFFYILGNFRIQNNIKKQVYTSSVFAISAFVLLNAAYEILLPLW